MDLGKLSRHLALGLRLAFQARIALKAITHHVVLEMIKQANPGPAPCICALWVKSLRGSSQDLKGDRFRQGAQAVMEGEPQTFGHLEGCDKGW